MNSKQLLILLLIISFSMTFVLAGILFIYNYDRTLLGFPPPSAPLTKDYVEPTVEISESQLKSYEYSVVENKMIRREKDSLEALRKDLLDSIKRINKRTEAYDDSVASVRDIAENEKIEKDRLLDSLTKVLKDNKDSENRVKLLNQRILDQEKFISRKLDSSEIENFKMFAKIYDGSKAEEVAKILEQIDEKDAAMILKFMKRKKAGKVIDAMLPEHAAAILLLGSSK